MKKYTDVDIIAELQKLVDSHVDSYKEDFDIDKRIIRRAAESQNPEDKTLMWFCRPHGTHCLNENQVFIQGTRVHCPRHHPESRQAWQGVRGCL